MKTFLSVLLCILMACCSVHRSQTKAKIIERRSLENKKLLLKYSFHTGSETIIDSVRTRNKIIPHDSLPVIYSVSEPGKNKLKF